jgi:hypothetical protein
MIIVNLDWINSSQVSIVFGGGATIRFAMRLLE